MVISESSAKIVQISLARVSSLEGLFNRKKVAAVSNVAVVSEPATDRVHDNLKFCGGDTVRRVYKLLSIK